MAPNGRRCGQQVETVGIGVGSVGSNNWLLFEVLQITIIPWMTDDLNCSPNGMIPAARLEELKKLFAEDGITLTNAEAFELGLWLVARTRSVLSVIPLDKAAQFGTIKEETRTIRRTTPFVNLSKWRHESPKKQKTPH